MADPRFFTAQGPFDLAELAVIAEADLAPGAALLAARPNRRRSGRLSPRSGAGPE